jgi:hypothetical protein
MTQPKSPKDQRDVGRRRLGLGEARTSGSTFAPAFEAGRRRGCASRTHIAISAGYLRGHASPRTGPGAKIRRNQRASAWNGLHKAKGRTPMVVIMISDHRFEAPSPNRFN